MKIYVIKICIVKHKINQSSLGILTLQSSERRQNPQLGRQGKDRQNLQTHFQLIQFPAKWWRRINESALLSQTQPALPNQFFFLFQNYRIIELTISNGHIQCRPSTVTQTEVFFRTIGFYSELSILYSARLSPLSRIQFRFFTPPAQIIYSLSHQNYADSSLHWLKLSIPSLLRLQLTAPSPIRITLILLFIG